jgi:hypothetical protein
VRRQSLLATFAAVLLAGAASAYSAPARLVEPARAVNAGVAKSVAASERGVIRARAVSIDLAALRATREALAQADAAPAVEVPLFEDATLLVAFTRARALPEGGTAYSGVILGHALGSAVLVEREGIVAANFVAPGFSYQVRYAGAGLHEARQVDQSLFSDHGDRKVPLAAPDAAARKVAVAGDAGDTVDVLVVYTSAARAAAGGTPAMQALVSLGITETNDAYAFSGVTQRLRLVGALETAYADSGDMGVDLARLRNAGDGHVDEAAVARDALGADFVSLWVENGGGGCGIGYLQVATTFVESYGFNVVARDCATGNYSFGHELGHNMGLRHDFFKDTDLTPYPYGHGYVDVAHGFRTVMAYNDACSPGFCTRIKAFSNPAVNDTLPGTNTGFPIGEPTYANAALSLNNLALQSANLRQAVNFAGAGSVALLYPKVSVAEGAGSLTVYVYRLAGSAGAASVNFAVNAGTATAGADFTASSGTLNWAAGDSAPKAIPITIFQDALGEGPETFSVALSAPVGVTIVPAGQSAIVTIVDDEPDAFPVGCGMPAGWTTPPGATAGWSVDTSQAAEGSCSLRSNDIGNSPGPSQYTKAQVAYTGTFQAGNISFKRRVSSEESYDCFRFLVDGVQQSVGGACAGLGPSAGLGASGELDWALVTVPVTAGVHTIVFSYEKDDIASFGDDAAWIDAVSLPVAVSYTLTIHRAGAGSGSVVSSPAGISCGATCAASFPGGTLVTLTATAEPGSTFAGWSGGGCAGVGQCVLALNADTPVTPEFVAIAPAGDEDGDGIPNAVEYAEGRNPLVKDNDVFSPGAGAARLFAMQQYRDFLGREGDPAGIQGWTDLVAGGTYTRPQVIDSFVQSAEFGGFVAPVVRLYFATFLRVPDYAGLVGNAALVRNGTVTLLQLADFFVASPEFAATYGALDNTQFVTLLYNNVLGRAPDQAGLDGWVALLAGGMSRGQVLLGFSDSTEYQAAMASEVLVTMMYTAMLRRTPEPAGFNGWVGFLDAATYTREQVINGFFLSTEYRGRFLP